MPAKRKSSKAAPAKGKRKYTRRGQPTKYKPELIAAAKILAQAGATDSELADAFQVDKMTILNWKMEHPEFFESLKVSKEIADNRVEQSLYHRAMGFSHPDIDIRVIDDQIVKTPIIKHYPPDTAAAIFWLKNRRRHEWRDRHDHTVLLANLSEEQLESRFNRIVDETGLLLENDE